MRDDLRAPIFTVCWDLCTWLLHKARPQPHDLLAQSLAQEGLRLLDSITLALKNIDREQALEEADVLVLRLRLRLRLAVETGLLDERQGQYALQQADSIGRQLGGWHKSLSEGR
ncbi:MAG: hypothetical protein AB7N91_30695 [Candidatus Tectimicrobiota bacterium]